MSPTSTRQSRSAARLHAVQALFQMEASGEGLNTVQAEFEQHRFGAEIEGQHLAEADIGLFRAILAGVVARQALIDQMTDRALKATWPIDRIDPVLRALFRAGGAELTGNETPPKVAISEYVDVAKAFFPGGKEPKLANGVLDFMAREARPSAF